MMDIVGSAKRSEMMANIKGKNTKPELLVRSGLHGAGFRFRLHARDLPGRPDIVLPKYKAAIFVHGCFWHMHECDLFKWPQTRVEFWKEKLSKNAQRDEQHIEKLLGEGWRVGVVWECTVRRHGTTTMKKIGNWLRSDLEEFEL